MANIVNKPIFGGYQQPSFPGGGYQQAGLLGYQQPANGLLGGGTQNLMQQYLMNLFMRRYNPPAIAQQPGMVSSQMGLGGMQYRAPVVASVPLPGAAQTGVTYPQGAVPYQTGGGYMLNGQGFFSNGMPDPNNGSWSS